MGTPLDIARMAVEQILKNHTKLSADDLQILRKNTLAAQALSSRSDYFMFRMDIELIDAIRSLDDASAKLIEQTNKLTARILWLTIVGVIIAAIGVAVAVLQLLHSG